MKAEDLKGMKLGETFVLFAKGKYEVCGYNETHVAIYDEPPSKHIDQILLSSCELLPYSLLRPKSDAVEWISVEDRPLITKDENGNWTCTEDGERNLIVAVPYKDSRKPNENLWWIRNCVIEDKTGLVIVCDMYNEDAGWEIDSVTHWMPLPSLPLLSIKR